VATFPNRRRRAKAARHRVCSWFVSREQLPIRVGSLVSADLLKTEAVHVLPGLVGGVPIDSGGDCVVEVPGRCPCEARASQRGVELQYVRLMRVLVSIPFPPQTVIPAIRDALDDPRYRPGVDLTRTKVPRPCNLAR